MECGKRGILALTTAFVLVLSSGANAHASFGDCGQPLTIAANPTVRDCLFILRASVAIDQCALDCLCEPSGGGAVTATDALLCLRRVTGQSVSLDCSCDETAVVVSNETIVPNPNSELSLTVTFDTDVEAVPRVIVADGTAVWDVPASGILSQSPGTQHQAMILGMKPQSDYALLVTAETPAAQGGNRQVLTHTTGALPVPPPIDVLVDDPDRMEPGVTLFKLPAPFGPAIYAIEHDGSVVWYQPGNATDVRRGSSGNIRYIAPDDVDPDDRSVFEVDMLGNQVRKVTSTQLGTVAVHHECYEMPNGNLLTLGHELRMIGGYPGDETYNVVGDEILEFTWDGTVINRISLFDVLDPYRVLPGFDAPIQDDLFGVPTKDWTHANAVIYDESDDTYIVSVRHQDIVAKIDRAGQLVWVIGEDVAETAGDDAWPFVQLVGPGSYPNHQHAPELTPLGTILMYDNANSTHMSRPVEFLVDEMNLTMTQEWEWFDPEQDPPVYAHFIGDADYQPGGTVLVDHAGQDVDPLVEDTSTTFTHMVEVDHATDEKVWEVVIRDYSDPPARTSGYRAERLPSLYP